MIAKARDELERALATAIAAAVTERVSVDVFATRIHAVMRNWAKQNGLDPKPLAPVRKDLKDFMGVSFYKSRNDQAALARSYVMTVTTTFRIEWSDTPRGSKAR